MTFFLTAFGKPKLEARHVYYNYMSCAEMVIILSYVVVSVSFQYIKQVLTVILYTFYLGTKLDLKALKK
jgi:hypothetical protein